MRIERLGLNKIKITLETEDMLRWNLSFESLSEDSTRSQEMFWDVMRKVEDEMNMDFENCRITVEAVPAEGNSLIMFITKSELDSQMKDGFANAAIRKYKYRVKRQPKQNELPILLFEFSDFDDVCSFAGECQGMANELGSESSLFKHRGIYYLAILFHNATKESIKEFSVTLSEYGNPVDNGTIKLALLSEHGELMIKSTALEVLSCFFVNKQ